MAQKHRARKAPSRSRPRPWVAAAIGLALFAGAVWVLAGGGAAPPMGEIGADSRAELERVLERADRR